MADICGHVKYSKGRFIKAAFDIEPVEEVAISMKMIGVSLFNRQYSLPNQSNRQHMIAPTVAEILTLMLVYKATSK